MERSTIFLAMSLLSLSLTNGSSQSLPDEFIVVNRALYRDYKPLSTERIHKSTLQNTRAIRPDHVNNAELKFFPPVFNQAGGSCGSAGYEGYNFTYEWNSLNDLDGSLPENQFPSHWLYLLAYQHSDREEVLFKNGIPNVVDYGGRTYSKIFGEQEYDDEYNGRMQGYDKWYRAMFHRAENGITKFPPLTSEEGREAMKNWLWNHDGDADFHGGGIACVGVAISSCTSAAIPKTTKNDEIGVTAKKYIASWGPQFDHNITIVGYDDRIEFDLDGNGICGEEGERGAWIICNSWGEWWENNGFIYCPYKYSYSVGTSTIPMTPGRWTLRKGYKPLRTYKILLGYSHRSELQLVAGVSEDLSSDYPSDTIVMSMFNYDGNAVNKTPAPACPMLGKWADGKIHDEAMEFGFDVTDLTEKVDRGRDLKYFFIVNSIEKAIGSGSVEGLTFYNYEQEADSLVVVSEKITIKNNGQKTIISFVVPGNGAKSIEDVCIKNGVLSWKTPITNLKVDKYCIYRNGELLDSISGENTNYDLSNSDNEAYYQVNAGYRMTNNQNTIFSKKTRALCPKIDSSTTDLTLSCNIDGTFLRIIRDNAYNGKLRSINLQNATIVSGGEDYYDGHNTSNNSIGYWLFRWNEQLTSLILPESLFKIEERICSNCTALSEIVIPDKVKEVGFDAFAYCSNLNTVTVGKSVISMDQGVFWGSNVKDAYVKPTTPPSLGAYLFSSNPIIHVYQASLAAYQASDWAQFGTLVGDLDDILDIEKVENTNNSIDCFNLFGNRTSNLEKNKLYIINGEKVIIK